jgi:hypothetical protein
LKQNEQLTMNELAIVLEAITHQVV